jgi:4-hydroxy-tetrahydrodipicolinate synthase
VTVHGQTPEAQTEFVFRILRTEGAATLVSRTVEQTRRSLNVRNGRAGLELPDNCSAIVNRMITCTKLAHVLVRFSNGLGGESTSKEEAEAFYRKVLPLLMLLLQLLDQFLRLRKHLIAQRLGRGEIDGRVLALAPSDFGLACLTNYAMHFRAFPDAPYVFPNACPKALPIEFPKAFLRAFLGAFLGTFLKTLPMPAVPRIVLSSRGCSRVFGPARRLH